MFPLFDRALAAGGASRFARLAVVLLALPLLAACASSERSAQWTPPPAPALPPQPVAPAPDPVPAFQRLMDRHDIPFEVPREGKAILVNIPSYELIAFEDGEPVMRSRVIVGRNLPGDRTPRMDTETSVVRFNPSWRPTPMMIRSGKYEDKTVPPGPGNPLGLLAIRLEPGMVIYLHGTNKPRLFERDSRAISAGCVRVERWDEVAAWVLGIGVEEVHRAADGRRTFDMDTSGVPVMMRYYTRFPDASGALRVHDDIYGLGESGRRI